MLSNNADAFFTTPMRHTVVRGGNVGNQNAMPAPRGVNESATGVVTTRMKGDFMPGLGDGGDLFSSLTAAAGSVASKLTPQAPAAPAPGLFSKLATPVGLGFVAAFLFLTPPGKALRRKVFG